MTHEELLAKIDLTPDTYDISDKENIKFSSKRIDALRAVVELHKPEKRIINLPASGETEVIFCANNCEGKYWLQTYPCPTIQAIEEQLK